MKKNFLFSAMLSWGLCANAMIPHHPQHSADLTSHQGEFHRPKPQNPHNANQGDRIHDLMEYSETLKQKTGEMFDVSKNHHNMMVNALDPLIEDMDKDIDAVLDPHLRNLEMIFNVFEEYKRKYILLKGLEKEKEKILDDMNMSYGMDAETDNNLTKKYRDINLKINTVAQELKEMDLIKIQKSFDEPRFSPSKTGVQRFKDNMRSAKEEYRGRMNNINKQIDLVGAGLKTNAQESSPYANNPVMNEIEEG